MPIYSGSPIQRGYGWGGMLKGLSALFAPLMRLFSRAPVSKAADMLRKVARNPIVKKSIKKAKKELAKSAANVVREVTSGEKNLKKSLQTESRRAAKKVGRATLKDIEERLVKSRHVKNTPSKRKRTIFDD